MEPIPDEHAMNERRWQSRRPPVQYKPDFLNVRYEDGHVFLQVPDTKNINLPEIPKRDQINHVIHCTMMQLSVKQGIKQWGKVAEDEAIKEMKQQHDMEVFTPVHSRDMSREQKQQALSSLMFLKEKSDGRIKGCACADGRPQRKLFTKEESTSPTVAIENVFLTATIDAFEGRDVATCDIPGAFLHTD